MTKVMETFKPNGICLQCGADSLSGDRLGCFNLTLEAHGGAVDFMRSFNIPMLVLGGGGYSVRNVPRCWTKETSVLCGQEVSDTIPENKYSDYFGPNYSLAVAKQPHILNRNPKVELEKIYEKVCEQLRDNHVSASGGLEQMGEIQGGADEPLPVIWDVCKTFPR